MSRIGQVVVLDPPNADGTSLEDEPICLPAPRTMLVFPSYDYPGGGLKNLDPEVAYLSPILAFNLNLHLSCLKSVVQHGGETYSDLFVLSASGKKMEKVHELSSVYIGLEPWVELPKYASHLRASFVKIPESGTLERLKTRSSIEVKDRQ